MPIGGQASIVYGSQNSGQTSSNCAAEVPWTVGAAMAATAASCSAGSPAAWASSASRKGLLLARFVGTARMAYSQR